ncbi:MAG TPA: polysaccharide deacetylase family protein [Candidatus Saccharimonadales bacterium]|nr:polysaccharide deacetylase family protein [Candidatus Saccharimonadales bacterium]
MIVLASIILVLGLLFAAGFVPRLPLFSRSRLRTSDKVVALTFDDGPSPYTPQVLKVLKRYHVRATFFVIGENVKKYPVLARRIVTSRHVLANHSNDHDLSNMLVSGPWATVRNVQTANLTITKATGVVPALYRPPHGYRSLWGAYALRRSGFHIVNWDNMTFDYRASISPQWIERRILKKVKPGSIIVLHDGKETRRDMYRGNMLAALPHIIEGLQAQGYQFQTVDKLLNIPAHKTT